MPVIWRRYGCLCRHAPLLIYGSARPSICCRCRMIALSCATRFSCRRWPYSHAIYATIVTLDAEVPRCFIIDAGTPPPPAFSQPADAAAATPLLLLRAPLPPAPAATSADAMRYMLLQLHDAMPPRHDAFRCRCCRCCRHADMICCRAMLPPMLPRLLLTQHAARRCRRHFRR